MINNNLGKMMAISFATGALVLSAGVEANAHKLEKAVTGTTTANLNVRPSAGTQGQVIKTLKKGTTVKIVGFNSNKTWAQLQDGNWVCAQYVKLGENTNNNSVKPSYNKVTIAMKELTVKASSLNVRTGPGTNYSVVGSLKQGQIAMTNAQSGDWYEIDTNRWIHKNYVTETIGSMNSNAEDELLDVAPGDEDPTRYVKVSEGSVLNVRYTRALGGSVKDRLPKGKGVTVLNDINGVSYIKYINTKGQLTFGYVASQYLAK